MKYKYKVNGLDCANCTQKLEDSLNKKEEINDCVISFATGMMTFESEYDIDDHELLSFMQSIEDEVTIEIKGHSYPVKFPMTMNAVVITNINIMMNVVVIMNMIIIVVAIIMNM